MLRCEMEGEHNTDSKFSCRTCDAACLLSLPLMGSRMVGGACHVQDNPQ